MLKKHQSMAERISNKGAFSAPVDIQTLVVNDNNSIQLRAYQIHEEKGGTALDNWLEAERILRNIDHEINSLSTANRRSSGGGG